MKIAVVMKYSGKRAFNIARLKELVAKPCERDLSCVAEALWKILENPQTTFQSLKYTIV